MKRLCIALLLTSALVGQVHAGSPDQGSADERFENLYKSEWTWRQQQFPGLDNEDREAADKDDRLPAVDAKAQAARLAYWDDVLKKLASIKPDELSPGNKVNYAVYKPQLENLAAGVRFRDYEMPLNSILVQPWGIAVKQGEKAFADFVSKAVTEWHKTGAITALEKKWNIKPTKFAEEMTAKYK